MIRHLQAVDYAARTKVFPGERVEHVTFNFTLENQIHRGGQYFNDKYVEDVSTSLSPLPPTSFSLMSLSSRQGGLGPSLCIIRALGLTTRGMSGEGMCLIILVLQVHWAASEVSVL